MSSISVQTKGAQCSHPVKRRQVHHVIKFVFSVSCVEVYGKHLNIIWSWWRRHLREEVNNRLVFKWLVGQVGELRVLQGWNLAIFNRTKNKISHDVGMWHECALFSACYQQHDLLWTTICSCWCQFHEINKEQKNVVVIHRNASNRRVTLIAENKRAYFLLLLTELQVFI